LIKCKKRNCNPFVYLSRNPRTRPKQWHSRCKKGRSRLWCNPREGCSRWIKPISPGVRWKCRCRRILSFRGKLHHKVSDCRFWVRKFYFKRGIIRSFEKLITYFFVEDGYVESYVDFFYIANNCMKDFL